MDENGLTDHGPETDDASPPGDIEHAIIEPDLAPSAGLDLDARLGDVADLLDESRSSLPSVGEFGGTLGPLSVEASHVDSGGILPDALALALVQLKVDLDTQPLSINLDAVGGGLGSELASGASLSADATVTLLERYEVKAHAEQGDVEALLDLMREGRPILLGVQRSEFWYTVDDRGAEPSSEPVRLGEWQSESDTVQLYSVAQPDTPLYEISKSALLARWRDFEGKLVVIDEAQQAEAGPLPVLVPVILDAAAGLRMTGRG